jgi:hypothetical protein
VDEDEEQEQEGEQLLQGETQEDSLLVAKKWAESGL